MLNTFFEKIDTVLTWRWVIAVNVIILIVLGLILSLRLLNVNTEIRSKAASVVPTPTPYSPPDYPGAPPVIDRVTPFYGKPGDAIVIQGTNFGSHPWESKLYVGGVEVAHADITNWTDSEVTVNIPTQAQSGAVWISVNGKQSTWNGSLSVSDGIHAAQVALTQPTATSMRITVSQIPGAVRGTITVSYINSMPTFTPSTNIFVTNQTQLSDNEGKFMNIEFAVKNASSQDDLVIGDFLTQNSGPISLLQATLYDSANRLLPLFANPQDNIGAP